MHIHILAVCGVFMGGVAALARQLGHTVTGSDSGVYPPMQDILDQIGVEVRVGFDPSHLQPHPDLVLIGNALSRGNPAVEYVLDQRLNYQSGPEWVARNVLADRWTLAVAGTHGKTTTAALLSFLLQQAGLEPGFLIGGSPLDFSESARLGDSRFFVIEADEYDTAFFDKRSKFIHYRPQTLVLNNLEFDHADIFPNLQAVETQFRHLLRTVPASGRVIFPLDDGNLHPIVESEPWSERDTFALAEPEADLCVQPLAPDCSRFLLRDRDGEAEVSWKHVGAHNMRNAAAAILAARHAGVNLAQGAEILGGFCGVRKRMEKVAETRGIAIYEDFAHHPTAIRETLVAARASGEGKRLVAVVELRSNTMRSGAHRASLASAVSAADVAYWLRPKALDWSLDEALESAEAEIVIADSVDELIALLVGASSSGDRVIVMSNGSFDGLARRLGSAIESNLAASQR